MSQLRVPSGWQYYAWGAAGIVIAPAILSLITGLWVLSAVSIGFLFGFFLQKGQLCGASAFSEVILMRDREKLWGLWVLIVTSMGIFAIGHGLHIVQLTPKPFMWINFLVGGLIFGAGTVLAGGCISGCLFKCGEGNINSIVALFGVAIGMSTVEYGHLNVFSKWMTVHSLNSDFAKGMISLPAITHIPYWLLATAFVLITIGIGIHNGKKEKTNRQSFENGSSQKNVLKRILTRRWKPYKAGMAIGVLALLAFLSSSATGRNAPLGVSHGVLFAHVLATVSDYQNIYQPEPKPQNTAQPTAAAQQPKQKVVWWLVFIVFSLVAGSWFSAKLSGDIQLLPRPPEQVLFALFGGLLVGIGAAIATGCVVGNIMSGWAMMSTGCILFGFATLLSNWAMTYVYLMGGLDR